MRLLRRKNRILLRALSRTVMSSEQQEQLISALGYYLDESFIYYNFFYNHSGNLHYYWSIQRHTKQVPITLDQFQQYYLKPYLEEIDNLLWDSIIRFSVDASHILPPFSSSQLAKDMIEILDSVGFCFEDTFHRPISNYAQMEAPTWLKDIQKRKRKARAFKKMSHAERVLSKQADMKIQKARQDKAARNPINEDVVPRFESQMDFGIEQFGESVRADIEHIASLNNEALDAAFAAHLQAADDDQFFDLAPSDEDDVPSLLSSLFGYMSSAKTAITSTAEWMADNICKLQSFFSRLWDVISKSYSIATTAMDWFVNTEDVFFIPKLVALFLIYIVGYAVGCSSIARFLAAFYSSWVFTGPLSWIPALLAVASSGSDRMMSQSDFSLSSLFPTVASLIAAALFGKLSSLADITRRDGFLATMDTVSRGFNGITNIADKILVLFRKDVSCFGEKCDIFHELLKVCRNSRFKVWRETKFFKTKVTNGFAEKNKNFIGNVCNTVKTARNRIHGSKKTIASCDISKR